MLLYSLVPDCAYDREYIMNNINCEDLFQN